MNRLILFIKRIYVLLLFIIIEVVAFNYYIDSSMYTRAKALAASNSIFGSVELLYTEAGDYLHLKSDNRRLTEEVARLRRELATQKNWRERLSDSARRDFLHSGSETLYDFKIASIVNNSITDRHNFITINKGTQDGVDRNMALITPEGGIVGYILQSSNRYSVAISILNQEFKTGGRIKDTDYFGSVWWDGSSHTHVMLSELPKYAEIEVGDTIVTGYSSIFPPDVLIGTVEGYELTQSTYYNARIKLLTPIATLRRVLVVDFAHLQELELLESEYQHRER